jgi:hypothetical protein
VATDPAKCVAIQEWGRPRTASDLRSFLGAVGYYRRYVDHFAEPLARLTPLLRKNARFEWTVEHEAAMSALKQALSRPPVLVAPNFSLPFLVVTDASDYALGGALLQVNEGIEHPVRYYSRTLAPAERNYSATDKEALAVVACLKQFRPYVLGTRVKVFSDHQALRQVLIDPMPIGRRARWVAALLEYDFEIRHRPGPQNLLADSLSRDQSLRAVEVDLTSEPDIDDLMHEVKRYLDGDGSLVTQETGRSRAILRHAQKMFVKDGELFRRRINGGAVRVLVSRSARQQVLREMHDGLAHFGEKSTYDIVSNCAWWPGIQKDAVDYVKSCDACQQQARLGKASDPISIPVARLFERISLDYIGPLPITEAGNVYIIVAMEALTRWPIARAVPSMDANTTARFIYEDIILPHGPPETILTDQGAPFINLLIEQLTGIMEVKHLRSSPYHPQANGHVERFNGTLCEALSRLATQTQEDWDLFLPAVLYAYRIRRHAGMNASPYEALFGQPPRLPNGVITG